jgi:tape measure domain-containing protein
MATRAMGALTAAFAAYKTIQGIIQQADAMTLLNSRLQLVTKSQQEFIRTQEALVSISQRSFTGLSSTVDLYTALSRATANLGVSQNELLRVVETFNKSIIISGGSVQAADAAITQFNQAMASGVLRGEEFNSISEQAPMIMELLANSLGVTRGALRDMAKEGLLVAELVLPALLEGSKSVDDQFAKLNKTIGQSGVQFKNQFALLIDELNKLTGGTEGASRGLDGFTFNLKILTDLLKAINGPAQAFNETQAETERLLRQNEQAAKANNEAVKSRAKAMLEEKERMEMAKKAAEELQKAYEKLIETLREDIRGSTAALQAEQQGLNKSQEDFLKLVSSPEWYQYTAAQKILITDLFKQKIETEQLIDLEKKRAKAAEDRLKKMLDDEKEFREELAKEDKKNEEDRIKAQEKLYEEHRKQIEKIEDDLTDALMRAFESGKGFGQAFKDTLINMFKTMVLRPVLAPIAGAFAGVFGGGGAMASGAGGGGALSALSGAGSLAQLAAGASSLGVGIAAGFSNALSLNFAGSLSAAGQLIGTGAMSGISAGLGMAAGTLLPIVGILAAIPSISKALFGGGRRTTATGISGTFTTGGADVMGFEDWRRSGGLFRRGRSGTNFSPVATETQSFLDNSLIAISDTTRNFARILGLNANAIDGINQQVRISLSGLSAEKQQEAIANALNSFGDRLAEELLGEQSSFIRIGETAGTALTRLATSLSTVNQVFDTLNTTLYRSSLAGADMANRLIDAFGGADVFIEQTTQFYEQFYTEAERTETATRQLTSAMSNLGFVLPKNRDQFRALVEAQDLTTESGRQVYAELIRLSSVFNQIAESFDNNVLSERVLLESRLFTITNNTVALRQREREAINDANKGLYDHILLLEEYFNTLSQAVANAISTANESLTDQISASRSAAAAARSAASTYRSAAESIRETIKGLLGSQRSTEQEFNLALQAASGGDVEAMKALPSLAQTFSEEAQKSAKNSLEATLINARIAAELQQVASVADVLELGSDYQAQLLDINTELLILAQKELQSENMSLTKLNDINDALINVAKLIDASGSLTVSAITNADGNTIAGLKDSARNVVGTLDANTLTNINALSNQGIDFKNAITGQTTDLSGFTEQQLSEIQNLDKTQNSVLDETSLVAMATKGNEDLSSAILNQLKVPDASAEYLGKLISAGNEHISERLLLVVSAVNAQTQAQQAEIQRQQDLVLAQQQLEAVSLLQQTTIGEVNQGIQDIYKLAENMSVFVNKTAGAAEKVNSAIFKVNEAGLFEAEYNQITGTSFMTKWFKEVFYKEGGVFDRTYGRAGELKTIADDIENLRARIIELGGIPEFANGGMHYGGMRLVGERGPELEMTGPARYMSNNDLSSMMGGNNNEEIKQLREDNKVQMRALVSLQSRMTRLLERWDGNGLPEERAVA